METEKNTCIRDVSFSSYLNRSEENFITKIAGSLQIPTPITTEEHGINIFGAESYFDKRMDDENPRITGKIGRNQAKKEPQMRPGTPSTNSEASWISQRALLKNSSRIQEKKATLPRSFLGFGCNYCSDEKSVHTNDAVKSVKREPTGIIHGSNPSFNKPSSKKMVSKVRVGLEREDYFSFPISNSGLENMTVKKQLKEEKATEESRKSLEVFGSDTIKRKEVSMVTWDAIPNARNLPEASRSLVTYEDDIGSEASSDLFEIENFSSCMTPFTRYEPSETSIEWSVVTASAADFSTISDCVEKKTEEQVDGTTKSNRVVKSKTRQGNGILGCKNHRAVRVVEAAFRRNEKPERESQWPCRMSPPRYML